MSLSLIAERFECQKLTLLFCAAIAALILVSSATAQTSFVQQARLGASDAVLQDAFGFSVAISGDTAIVGGPRNGPSRGAVYIYVRSGSTWTEQQKLIHSDAMGNDQFGYSVAISGNTAAVGRFNTITGANRADGKVYIFTRTGTTWTETQTLVSNDIAQGDVFGSRLAFENDTLVISSYLKNNGATAFQGAVYVFTRPAGGGNFTEQAKLLASDGAQFDYFGFSIALSGDTAVIGAAGQAGFPNSRGKAYVFVRNGTSWSEQHILQAADGATGDAFGFSVGVGGDTAFIGAPNDATGGTAQHGSAYLFTRSGSTWTQQQKVMHADIATNDFFGTSVAIKGDTAVAGSSGYEPNGGTNSQGAVFVFSRNGAAWTQTQRLSQNLVRPDALGGSIAYDGTSIITGAFANSNEIGAAYIFAPDVYTQQSLAPNTNSGHFGHSVAMEGDTLVVGASTEQRENPQTGLWSDGAVYIYVRNGSNWVQQARLLANDPANGRQFGESVAISGNTIVIGAVSDNIGANEGQGSAYSFHTCGLDMDVSTKNNGK